MAKPVVTSTLRWDTRKDAEADCFRILRLAGYSVGDTVSNVDDIAILQAILSIHPHATKKTGIGVHHFEIRQMVGTPGVAVSADSIGIWIVRSDGSVEDFSYLESIYPSDQKRNVTSALRETINDLRVAYRDRRFSPGYADSDVSGNRFLNRAAATVIYESPSFAQMAFRFADSEGGWNAVNVRAGGGSGAFVGEAMTDVAQRERWRRFFTKYARPQLATKSEGASRPKTVETAWTP